MLPGAVARITADIRDAAIKAHRALGRGLLESAYREALLHELTLRGHAVHREVAIPLEHEELLIPVAYRVDLVVDGVVLVEIKRWTSCIPSTSRRRGHTFAWADSPRLIGGYVLLVPFASSSSSVPSSDASNTSSGDANHQP